jgi:UDP-N-acetylglucosamine 2-epimerase (non-hydrolysing)
MVIAGTRPEAIKMAPVVKRLRRDPARFDVELCATAQHRELLDQVLRLFDLKADVDLDVMRAGQSPSEVAARVFAAFDPVLAERRPDWVLVQGDTTTAMAAAIAAFHRGARIGHVEAGLRTGDLRNPFPEEMNRRVTDVVSDAFFAPTARAVAALRAEGTEAHKIFLTGNTIVDALLEIEERLGPAAEENMVLITTHRRESFGEPLTRIVRAIARLARAFPATRFVHVVHPNPQVRSAVERNRGLGNVELVEPQDYDAFIDLLRRARLILTDSGGVQEEAPTFGKPLLVLREKTERPEGIEAGVALLVGTDADVIFSEAARLLTDEGSRRAMSARVNPYGDGHAADRIADILAGGAAQVEPPASRAR